jgi:hypothetical protein
MFSDYEKIVVRALLARNMRVVDVELLRASLRRALACGVIAQDAASTIAARVNGDNLPSHGVYKR